MMAKYRYVQTSFWKDPFIQKLTPEEKFFYLYLLTNEHTSQCGIYEITRKTMVFDTGYNEETIDKLLKRFIEYRKIEFNEENSELMLVNWVKHNTTTSPKVKKKIEEELKKVKTVDFINAYIKSWHQMGYPIDTLSIPYAYPIDRVCIPNRKEKEKEKENKEHKEGSSNERTFENIPEEERTKKDYLCKVASFLEDDFSKASAFFKSAAASKWKYAVWCFEKFWEQAKNKDDPFKYMMKIYTGNDNWRQYLLENHKKNREKEREAIL